MFAWIVRSKVLLRAPACLRVLFSLAHVHHLALALGPLLVARRSQWVPTDACQARLPKAASTPRVRHPAPLLALPTRARLERPTPAAQCHRQLLSLPCLVQCPLALVQCLLALVPCRLALVPCRLDLVPCRLDLVLCLPVPVLGLGLAHGP